MNARDLRVCGAAVAAAVCLSACASGPRDWRDLGERTLPFQDVWNGLVETSLRHGFPVNESQTDRGQGTFVSRWRSWSMGFGQGRRLRVCAELKSESMADAKMTWRLRFCVERQTVPDMAHSMDPRENDWKPDGQERDLEDVIEAQLRLRFGDTEVHAPRSSTRT